MKMDEIPMDGVFFSYTCESCSLKMTCAIEARGAIEVQHVVNVLKVKVGLDNATLYFERLKSENLKSENLKSEN